MIDKRLGIGMTVLGSAVLLIAAYVYLGSIFRERGWPTVPGPESPELLEDVGGRIFFANSRWGGPGKDRIEEIDIRTRKQIGSLNITGKVVAISQSCGKIAYLVSHFDATHHELMLRDRKTERVLRHWTTSFYPASYPDKSGLDGRSGGAIALSNGGNQIAITETPKGTLPDPNKCELEVQDLVSGQIRVVANGVCGSGITWLLSDQQIVFVQSVFVGPSLSQTGLNEFGSHIGDGRKAVVSILDLKSGKVVPVCDGMNPILTMDGQHLLYTDAGGSLYRLVSLVDHSIVDIHNGSFEDGWNQAFAFSGEKKVLAWANPTSKNPQDKESMLSAIKIIDLATGKFVTVIGNISNGPACYAR